MEKGKVISLLKTLSAVELRRLREFVASPFYNKNEELSRLLAYLYKQAPVYKTENVDRKKVYKVLYGGGPFRQDRFYNLESKLVKLIEKFLLTTAFYADEFMPSYYLLKTTIDRSLEKNYHDVARKVEQQLNKNELSSVAHFQRLYLIDDLKNERFLAMNIRKADDSLQHAADNFDYYYLCQKLKYACEILDRNKQLKTNYTIKLFKEIETLLEQKAYADVPLIYAYRLVYFILKEKDDEQNYMLLKKVLKGRTSFFTKKTSDDLFSYGLNYCIRKMLEGHPGFIKEALDLYLTGLGKDAFLEDGYLSPWHFKNIVALGMNLKRYQWTEAFIENNKEKLRAEVRQNAVNFNKAEVYYKKRELDKVLDSLAMVRFTDVYYGIGTRMLQCKVYYEKGDWELLRSLISSFKIYLNRQEGIAKNIRVPNLNFLNFLSKLLKPDINRKKLKAEIGKALVVASRSWLLEVLAGEE